MVSEFVTEKFYTFKTHILCTLHVLAFKMSSFVRLLDGICLAPFPALN